MARYAAPMDGALRASTWLLVLLLGGLAVGLPALGWLAPGPEDGPLVPLLLVPIPLAATLLLTWALAPRGFSLGGGALVVERPLGSLRLPLASVRAVEVLAPEATRGALRLAGTAGLFGHYGRFWSPALGPYRLYARRRAGLVAVDAEGGRFVLSPEPPEAFAAALRAAAPRAAPALPRTGGAARPRAPWWLAGVVIGAVALAVAGLALSTLAYAPRGVTVTGAAVVVERRLAGPVTIARSELRGASVLPAERRAGWRRVNGTAWGEGVAWGRFEDRTLGAFRLYAWRPGPAVLLITGGGPVVVTPEDPEAFVAAVRAGLP